MKFKTVHFNNVSVGVIPRVVGTVTSIKTLEGLNGKKEAACDLVEARMDVIGLATRHWLDVCHSVESSGLPVIMTLRFASEGGQWTGSDEERLKAFTLALQFLAAVDVELSSPVATEVVAAAKQHKKPAIVSYHNFDRTPSLPELKDVILRAESLGDVVVKISTMVNSSEDIRILQELMDCERTAPLCVIGMGAKGTETRISLPCSGSCLTYGFLDEPAAPGQLEAAAIVKQLRQRLPAYNHDVIARKEILESA